MRLTKKKAKIIKSTIEAWVEENVISQNQSQMVLDSYEVVGFDWKRLAKYSFWISIICIIVSVGAIIAADFLRELLTKIFKSPETIKCLFAAIIAALIYYYGIKRKNKKPEKVIVMKRFFSRVFCHGSFKDNSSKGKANWTGYSSTTLEVDLL